MSIQDSDSERYLVSWLTLVRVGASFAAGTAAHSLYGLPDLPMAPTDFDLMRPRSLGLCKREREQVHVGTVLGVVRWKTLTLKELAALVFDLARRELSPLLTTAALELEPDIGSWGRGFS
jgi:hypothetical protein